jgi:hypothetical protein
MNLRRVFGVGAVAALVVGCGVASAPAGRLPDITITLPGVGAVVCNPDTKISGDKIIFTYDPKLAAVEAAMTPAQKANYDAHDDEIKAACSRLGPHYGNAWSYAWPPAGP